MRKRDFEKIGRQIISLDSGFVARGQMVIALPVGDILRGLFLDGSDFSKSEFIITVFYQPLFPPLEHVHLTFGLRLANRFGLDLWDSAEESLIPDIREAVAIQALPFLSKVEDASSVASMLDKSGNLENLNALEAFALCLARSGKITAAQHNWRKLRERVDLKVSWQVDILGRVDVIESAFTKDQSGGQILLDHWAEITRANLGLPD